MRFIPLLAVTILATACGPSLEDHLTDLVNAKDHWIDTVGCRAYSYEFGTTYGGWRSITITDPCREPLEWSEIRDQDLEPTMLELYNLVFGMIEDQHESGGERAADRAERIQADELAGRA